MIIIMTGNISQKDLWLDLSAEPELLFEDE